MLSSRFSSMDHQMLKQFAMEMAQDNGRLLIERMDQVEITEQKDVRDICTELDLWVEQNIIKKIKSAFPGHGIISEELGEIAPGSEYVWIIDPIDGTKHFAQNVPLFTISIALAFKGELTVGVVFDPSTHHLYHAHKGGGAFLNNKRISVSNTAQIDKAFIHLDTSKLKSLKKKDATQALRRLNALITNSYRIRTLGVGSLGLCYLAQGAYDAYFDLTGKTKYVDIAAGTVIVEEAGGYVRDLDGSPVSQQTSHLFASNHNLHAPLQKMLLDL